MKFIYFFVVIVTISILTNCCSSAGENDSKVITTDNINIRYQVSTVVNIGVDESQNSGDAPYLFASIRGVDCDKNGNIYVLVGKEECVRVFDKFGNFLRSMFRRGKGPRELANSINLGINHFSNSLFILNEQGYKMKEFDLQGNFIRDINLPKQFFFQFQFLSRDKFLHIGGSTPGNTSYDNILEVDLVKGRSTRGYLQFPTTARDDTYNHCQRFAIKENILWTSTIDTMDLKALDLKSGRIFKTIPIPGNFRKNQVYEASYMGQKTIGLLAYNFIQPFFLGTKLFLLLTVKEYDLKKKPGWKVVAFPKSTKLSLMEVTGNYKVQKVMDLDGYDTMELACTYNHRIIFFTSDPYYHIKIIEVVKKEGRGKKETGPNG